MRVRRTFCNASPFATCFCLAILSSRRSDRCTRAAFRDLGCMIFSFFCFFFLSVRPSLELGWFWFTEAFALP